MAPTPPILAPRPRRLIALIVGQSVLLLVLLLGAAGLDFTLSGLRSRQTAIAEQRAKLNEALVGLVDMQTGLRGYVLAENPLFFAPYTAAEPQVAAVLVEMAASPIAGPEYQAFRASAGRWQAEVAQKELALIQAGNFAAARSMVQDTAVLAIFDEVRQNAVTLRATLRAADEDTAQKIRTIDTLQLIGTAVLALLAFSTLVLLGRFLRRERHLWEGLRATSADLSQSNIELTALTAQQQSTNDELSAISLRQQETNSQLKARVKELRLLNDLNEMFISSQPVAEIYAMITRQIGEMLGGWCSITLRRPPPDDEYLDLAGIYHPDPAKLSFMAEWLKDQEMRTDTGLHAPLFTSGETVVLLQVPPEVSRPAELPPELAPIADLINLTSYIAAPITIHEYVEGVIAVASSTSGYYFDADQELFLSQIADRISLWIENRRLFTMVEGQARALQISFDSITDIVVTYDHNGRKVRINQAGRDFLQLNETAPLPPQLAFRNPQGQLLSPEEHPVRQALNGEIVHDIELAVLRHDGQFIIHAVSVAPLRTPGGAMDGAVLVARDISVRKELDRMKEEFVANMSHELRTPLTAILGYSDLLLQRRQQVLTPWHLTKIEGIRTGGHRLLALVNDLLDVAKLDAGQVTLQRKYTNLHTLMMNQRNLVLPIVQDKQLAITLDFAETLPRLYLDEDRISQVLTNLLSNATKFTPSGGKITLATGWLKVAPGEAPQWQGRPLDVDLPALAPGQFVVVTISDTGVGIPQEAMPHLWDRFYQAEGGSSRRFGGTGLGLAIVRQLIELHGGLTWAASPGPNQGSSFVFLLPVGSGSTAAMPYWQNGPTVLMVEDDTDTARIFELHLHGAGFNVVHARTAQEALEWGRVNKPAVITLDLLLPDLDGWTLLASLREQSHLADVPIVVISISDAPPVHLAVGISEYLVKPIRGDMLIEMIKRVTSSAPLSSASVLIVDDDADLVAILEASLQEHGFRTRVANNGRQAIVQLLADDLPGLILLDLMMPDMDGFQVLARLREDARTRGIPVIVITARDLQPDELDQLRYATQGIQFKHQMNIQQLLAEVQRHVHSREGEDDA